MFYQQCKNITKYETQFQKIINDIYDYNLIINDIITLQFFNKLKFFFKT